MAETEAESNSNLTDESKLSEGEKGKHHTQVAVKQEQSEKSSSPVGNEDRKKADKFDKVVEWLGRLQNLPENSNSNEVAVILKGFPLVKITKLEAEELEAIIRQRINLSEHKESVQFISVRHEKGAMIFTCANEITKMWLKQTVPEMKTWLDTKLEVGPADILVHSVKFALWVSKKGTDEILNLLDNCNDGISTSEWAVTEREDSDGKTKLVVWVDNKAFNVLKSRKLTLSFSPCLITFEPLLQLDLLKKVTGLWKFITKLPRLHKKEAVKPGTAKLAVVNPSQCSVKRPNYIDLQRSCDLRYWQSAQVEAPQNRIAAETFSHCTDSIDNNFNKHGNIRQSFSASSRLIASDPGHIYGLHKTPSREPTFQDSDVAGSHKLHLGSLNNNLPHSLARRLGDSGQAHSHEMRLGDSDSVHSRERRLQDLDPSRSSERQLQDLEHARSHERQLGESDTAHSRDWRLRGSYTVRSNERRFGDSDRACSHEGRLGDSERSRSFERRFGNFDCASSHDWRLGDSDRAHSLERRFQDSDRSSGHTRSFEWGLGDLDRDRSRERRLGDSGHAHAHEGRLLDLDHVSSRDKTVRGTDLRHSLENRFGASLLGISCEPGDARAALTNASVISGGVPNTTRNSRFDQVGSCAASFGGTAVPQSVNFGDWRGIKSTSTEQPAQMSTTRFSHFDNTSSLLLGTGNNVITSSSSKGLSDLGQTHSRDVGFTDSNLTHYQSLGFGNSGLGQFLGAGSGSINRDHPHLTGASDSDSLLVPVLTDLERARLRAAVIEDSKFRSMSASGLGESNVGHLRLDMFRETALSRLRAAGLSVSDLALLLVAGFPESEMSRFLARGFPESDLTQMLAAKFSASGPAQSHMAESAESGTMHTRAAIFGKSAQDTRLEMTGSGECDWSRSHVSDLVKSESGLLGVPGQKELDRGHSGRQGLGEFDRRHSSRLGLGESGRRPTDKRRPRESRWDRPPGQGVRESDRGHSNAIQPEESHLRMPGLEKSSQFHSRERGIGNSDLFHSCAPGLRDSEWSNSRVPGAAEPASSRAGNYSSALALSHESLFLGSNMHHHRGVGSSSVPSLENFNVDHLRENIPDHSDRKRFRETGTGFADTDCYRGQQFVGLDQTDLRVAGPVGLGLVHTSGTRFAAPESRHSHETRNDWGSGDNGRTERDRGDARGRATGRVKERKDDRNRDTNSRQMSERERRSREKRVWNRERGNKR